MNCSPFKNTVILLVIFFPLAVGWQPSLFPFSIQQYYVSTTAQQIGTKRFAQDMHELLLFPLQLHVFPGYAT